MAKNSVETEVRLIATNHQLIKLEGTLISEETDGITFRYRQKGQRRIMERYFARDLIGGYSKTQLYVQQSATLLKIKGQLGRNKINGFLTLDNEFNFNPKFAEAIADLGVEGGGTSPAAAKKKKKKAA